MTRTNTQALPTPQTTNTIDSTTVCETHLVNSKDKLTHKQHYINKTSELIHKHYGYPLHRAVDKVTMIYNNVINQLIWRNINRQGNNRLYKFRFDKPVFNNDKFNVNKKPYITWKAIQEVNPLLVVVKDGNTRIGISDVQISTELNAEVKMLCSSATVVVDSLTKPNDVIDKIYINSDALQDFSCTTEDRKHRAIAKQLLFINSANGYIPHVIRMSDFGRKYYRGSRYTNVQFTPKEVRKACFKGCTEIDINSCSNSFLIQEAKKYNLPHKYLKQFKRFKSSIRHEVTKFVFGLDNCTDENVKSAKRGITAIGMGSVIHEIKSPGQAKYFTLVNDGTFTVEQYNRFVKHTFVKGYYSELQAIQEALVKHNQHLKKLKLPSLHTNGDITKNLKKGKVLNYMYQHFETKVMQTVLKKYKRKIRLSVHDGVYMGNLTTTEINKIELGFKKFNLTVTVKAL